MLFPTSNVPSHRRSLVQCNWCLSLHMISSTNLLSSISKIYDIRIEDFGLAWNSGKQLKASSVQFSVCTKLLVVPIALRTRANWFRSSCRGNPMFGLHCSGTYLSPDLGEFTYCEGWVWGKFGDWCFFQRGKDVFLLGGWLVVESLATAGLNTILGTLRPRNSTRSCGLFFCVSLVFAGARWYLQELSESVATIEAWLAVKTPRQSHVVDLCCGKQGRSGRPCGEPVGVRRSINETSFELTQLVTMVFYDETCQFFLQVNLGFFWLNIVEMSLFWIDFYPEHLKCWVYVGLLLWFTSAHGMELS